MTCSRNPAFVACLWACSALLGCAPAGNVRGADAAASSPPREVRISGPSRPSLVPPPLRRGSFLSPQAVSAVDVSDDGKSVAVGTMAFRHDRNFFLLSAADGKALWGRHVEPWAPYQVAAVAGEGDGALLTREIEHLRPIEGWLEREVEGIERF